MEQKNELKWIVTARPMDGYVLHLTFLHQPNGRRT